MTKTLRKFIFYNIAISCLSSHELIQILIDRRDGNEGCSFHFLAASTFGNDFLQQPFPNQESTFWIADGKPLEAVLRVKYSDYSRGLRSFDFVSILMKETQFGIPLRHFLISSSLKSVDMFKQSIHENTNHHIVGNVVAPFSNEFGDYFSNWLNLINESNADVVWISLGSPKQDIIAYELSQRSGKIFIAIGAGLDFFSGNRVIAPSWFRFFYLEWLFRLIQEPRRLWKRYLFGNIRFVILSILFFMNKHGR